MQTSLLLLFSVFSLFVATATADDIPRGYMPTRQAHLSTPLATDPMKVIKWNGGPLMLGNTSKVYIAWYGNWTNRKTQIVPRFINNLSKSPLHSIQKTYYEGTKDKPLSSIIGMGKQKFISGYKYGKTLESNTPLRIVQDLLKDGTFPADGKAYYLVLTGPDIKDTGLCSSYCGWHSYATISGKSIKYAYIGDSGRCPNNCAPQSSKSPNGDVGIDGMLSVIAHEIWEMGSDPQFNAWYNGYGEENADICSWTFNKTFTTPNGARANVKLNGTNYMIQQNWVNKRGGYCGMNAF